MAVAPAWMADSIIVLDDDGDQAEPQPSSSAAPPQGRPRRVPLLKADQPVATHITRSPFATAKKESHVLKMENEKLFSEFVDHCSTLTEDCPEVMTFLHAKFAKASPEFLSSVEFRNTVGRCLTRAQANRAKTFVFIQELCTVLRKHAAKKRPSDASASASNSPQSTPAPLKSKDKTKGESKEEDGAEATEDEKPSTSGLQEENEDKRAEQLLAEKKASRASRKQIAYLEKLLKVYHEEIAQLQQTELSLDDLEAEDSKYIQEHKLKRKLMKIYEKLCELKGCNKFTGRAIEERIPYRSTRYPEINKRIERFINGPEARWNPPDYQDILQQVLRANDRHNLHLSRKELTQFAHDAFINTGSRMQERRHQDMVLNFACHLTADYKPSSDPALRDPSLNQKLRKNREVALSRLEEVITKYAVQQDTTDAQERSRRQEKKGNNGSRAEKDEGNKDVNGQKEEEEEEEEEDEEEDESSDPDIEEEIQASTRQDGPDDNDNDEEEEEDENEAEQADDAEETKDDQSCNPAGGAEGEEPATSGTSPLSDGSNSAASPSGGSSPALSPGQSEPAQADDTTSPMPNGNLEEPVTTAATAEANGSPAERPEAERPEAERPEAEQPEAEQLEAEQPEAEQPETMNGVPSPPSPSPRLTRTRKRKREELQSENKDSENRSDWTNVGQNDSEADLPLDMGVSCYGSPRPPRSDTPTQDQVTSSQTTPPPKRNKVNVATQCDPLEIIVLSDSE